MALSVSRVHDLAILQPGAGVLSVYARTDPRDPANTATTPRWLIELRNELREVTELFQGDADRERRLQLRDQVERVESDVLALEPRERARGLAWFQTADGTLDDRFALQLPPRQTLVRWDSHPFVSPLVDVVDRGRPTGLVLISAEAVRLSHWRLGRVQEPERSVYELELGQWRDYDAYVGHGGRGAGGMHVATFSDRVADWRERFLGDAAAATAQQVADLGWQRLVLVGESRHADMFSAKLPPAVRDRVIATVDANLIWEGHAAVADRLEPVLDDAWRQQTAATVDAVIGAAAAGGNGVTGWNQVLECLVNHHAGHVVIAPDAEPDLDRLDPRLLTALDDPSPRMIIERAVEVAVGAGAEVTIAPDGIAALTGAGGVVATLRY